MHSARIIATRELDEQIAFVRMWDLFGFVVHGSGTYLVVLCLFSWIPSMSPHCCHLHHYFIRYSLHLSSFVFRVSGFGVVFGSTDIHDLPAFERDLCGSIATAVARTDVPVALLLCAWTFFASISLSFFFPFPFRHFPFFPGL